MLEAAKLAVKRHLPPETVAAIGRVRRATARQIPWPIVKLSKQALYWGAGRTCPVCDSSVRHFVATRVLPNERCPVCKSNRRTRLIWLYLSRHTNLFDGSRHRVLHVAPERGIAAQMMAWRSLDYVACDLDPSRYLLPRNMLTVDLTRMQFDGGSFDAVICNHVLEHIPDDRSAMREILRVLKPGGFAVLLVPEPHKLAVTIEDPDAPPDERARRFGQENHVRLYGADYADILRSIGFDVRVWMARDAEPELCRQWDIDTDEEVYTGWKR